MRIRKVLTTLVVLAGATLVVSAFTLRRADLREAAIEARNPPEGEIVLVDGREVHVVVKGEGPDLVLIHGAGGSSRDFTIGLADQLAESFRVFVVDRPGFGWSERVDTVLNEAWTTASESPLEQARHLADAVAQLGAEKPIILGHSFGGAVAMGWALEADAAGIVIVSGATMP